MARKKPETGHSCPPLVRFDLCSRLRSCSLARSLHQSIMDGVPGFAAALPPPTLALTAVVVVAVTALYLYRRQLSPGAATAPPQAAIGAKKASVVGLTKFDDPSKPCIRILYGTQVEDDDAHAMQDDAHPCHVDRPAPPSAFPSSLPRGSRPSTARAPTSTWWTLKTTRPKR